jgi:surface antigen
VKQDLKCLNSDIVTVESKRMKVARPKIKAAASAITVLFMSALAAFAQGGPKEQQGSFFGNLVGGVIGNLVPGGGNVVGEVLRSQAGTIGGMIGGSLGAQLDAEDQAALAAATRSAFDSGKARNFSGAKSGVKGLVKVTSTTKDETGRLCRTGEQTITFKDGQKSSGTVSGCKGKNGKWEV